MGEFASFIVSMGRIQKFLELDDINPNVIEKVP